MAILITGGTGFVGGNVVKELVENKKEWGIKKNEIFVLVREKSNIDELKKLGVELVIGDLTDHESLKKAVKGKSLIFHLGAVVLDQVSPEILQKVNVEGTEALLNAFVKEKTAKKFVFVSTWGVYGYKVKPKPLKENQPFNPTNEYHKSKLDSEQITWNYHKDHKLPVAVARLPMILGPSDTLTTPRVVQAFFDEEVKMVGKGKNLYSGVDVRDAARAILAMGLKDEANGNVYNVKSFDISQKDYWYVHKDAIKSDFKIPNFPRWVVMIYAWFKEIQAKRKGIGKPTLTRFRVMRYGNTRILDISRIQKDLGWEPIHKDGHKVIQESVDWLNEHKYIDYENKKVVLIRKWEDDLKRKK
ncbi:MAG: NAD(P)-dependent oxidoreductase [Asgard group archaeon]|nr:NAD(P)-dependent oxidoreductase [Asgard group archaeon]